MRETRGVIYERDVSERPKNKMLIKLKINDI